jgi:hypothetical protein
MLLVSVTRLRLRSARYLIPFMIYALMSSRQARRSRGNLGVRLLRDANHTFWTLTAWQKDGYALFHDGRISSAGHAQTAGLVR